MLVPIKGATRYSSVSFWTIYIYVQVIKKSFFKFICLKKTNWFYASACLHSYIVRFCIHPIILKRNIASLQWSHMNDLYIIMKLSQISTLELRYTIGYWTLDKRLCQNHTLESVHDLKLMLYWPYIIFFRVGNWFFFWTIAQRCVLPVSFPVDLLLQ